jgi:hypothetical protein
MKKIKIYAFVFFLFAYQGVYSQLYSIGNQVWADADSNGTKNGMEAGIQNVLLHLYIWDSLHAEIDYIASTTTDSSGLYLFNNLDSNTINNYAYIVVIDSSNFAVGSPLWNYKTSKDLLTSSETSPFCPPPTNVCYYHDSNDNVDNDDDGFDNFSAIFYPPFFSNNFAGSKPIFIGKTKSRGGKNEPTDEDPHNDTSTPDDQSNLTIDFGFKPIRHHTAKALTGDWSAVETWTTNTIPDNTKNVVIPAGAKITLDISTATARSVKIMPNGELNISHGKQLNVK